MRINYDLGTLLDFFFSFQKSKIKIYQLHFYIIVYKMLREVQTRG